MQAPVETEQLGTPETLGGGGYVMAVGVCWEIEMALRVALTTVLSLGPFLGDLTNVLRCPVRDAHHQ